MSILPSLTGNAKQRAQIKAKELALLPLRQFVHEGLRVKITSLTEIDGGIEVFAQAWRNGKQLGFGKDGTVDIERFRIFNPPILVPDELGPIVRESTHDGIVKRRPLREDPTQALKEALAHTISVVGIEGADIEQGKIGRTTSTFFSDAGGDGYTENNNLNYANGRNAASGTAATAGGTQMLWGQQFHVGSSNYFFWRSHATWDTSSLPDTDEISAAVLSLFGTTKEDTVGTTPSAQIVSNSQASDTSLASGDYDQLGTTVFSTISYAAFSTVAYNDFTLDANGIAQISKTGFSKFGMRTNKDVSATPPSNSGNNLERLWSYAADQAGTTNDPKLVITHAAPAASANCFLLLDIGT